MTKGPAAERELVNRLEDEYGYRALRAPGSGSATDRDRPDVLAGKDGRVVMFEAKLSSGKPVYVGHDEAEALLAFADGFGATPYIAVRWKSRSIRDTAFYLANPFDMHDSGKNYRAKYDDCVEKDAWMTLDALLG